MTPLLGRLLVSVISTVVILGAAGVLVGVMRTDLSLLGKLLVTLIAAAAITVIASTLVWVFRPMVTERGYFALTLAERPRDPQELRLWRWTKVGSFCWIVLMGSLLIFAIAAKVGLLG